MIIAALAQDVDRYIGRTLGVLEDCGFHVRVIKEEQLKSFERVIPLKKHPRRKHNGTKAHRRRFAFYWHKGVLYLCYVEGAEPDETWYRDLHHKLECEMTPLERSEFSLPLAKLQGKFLSSR